MLSCMTCLIVKDASNLGLRPLATHSSRGARFLLDRSTRNWPHAGARYANLAGASSENDGDEARIRRSRGKTIGEARRRVANARWTDSASSTIPPPTAQRRPLARLAAIHRASKADGTLQMDVHLGEYRVPGDLAWS